MGVLKTMKPVNVAILGACGWMGKCHSLGYRNAPLMFPYLFGWF